MYVCMYVCMYVIREALTVSPAVVFLFPAVISSKIRKCVERIALSINPFCLSLSLFLSLSLSLSLSLLFLVATKSAKHN